jgi:hypothetical protein
MTAAPVGNSTGLMSADLWSEVQKSPPGEARGNPAAAGKPAPKPMPGLAAALAVFEPGSDSFLTPAPVPKSTPELSLGPGGAPPKPVQEVSKPGSPLPFDSSERIKAAHEQLVKAGEKLAKAEEELKIANIQFNKAKLALIKKFNYQYKGLLPPDDGRILKANNELAKAKIDFIDAIHTYIQILSDANLIDPSDIAALRNTGRRLNAELATLNNQINQINQINKNNRYITDAGRFAINKMIDERATDECVRMLAPKIRAPAINDAEIRARAIEDAEIRARAIKGIANWVYYGGIYDDIYRKGISDNPKGRLNILIMQALKDHNVSNVEKVLQDVKDQLLLYSPIE